MMNLFTSPFGTSGCRTPLLVIESTTDDEDEGEPSVLGAGTHTPRPDAPLQGLLLLASVAATRLPDPAPGVPAQPTFTLGPRQGPLFPVFDAMMSVGRLAAYRVLSPALAELGLPTAEQNRRALYILAGLRLIFLRSDGRFQRSDLPCDPAVLWEQYRKPTVPYNSPSVHRR